MIRNIDIVWNLHEGYDWLSTRQQEAEKKARKSRKVQFEDPVPSTDLYETPVEIALDLQKNEAIFIEPDDDVIDDRSMARSLLGDVAIDSTMAPPTVFDRPLNSQNQETLSGSDDMESFRRGSTNVEISVKSFNFDFDSFEPGHQVISRLSLKIKDIEILDQLGSSVWRKFLTNLKPMFDEPDLIRESSSDMVKFEMLGVQPSAASISEEIRLKVRISSLSF